MLHELAARDPGGVLEAARQRLGSSFRSVLATTRELPVADAISNYPFNSQIVTLPDQSLRVIAPIESQECDSTRRFLERVVAEDNPVTAVDYLDVRQSMSNGGGPACLRLRIVLTGQERSAIKANVFVNHALLRAIDGWIDAHYRDRLGFDDLYDPAFLRDSRTALDELTELLGLGSVYAFQR
jgi:succinylarginine dihydrolase